jgi:hypothetical protein
MGAVWCQTDVCSRNRGTTAHTAENLEEHLGAVFGGVDDIEAVPDGSRLFVESDIDEQSGLHGSLVWSTFPGLRSLSIGPHLLDVADIRSITNNSILVVNARAGRGRGWSLVR